MIVLLQGDRTLPHLWQSMKEEMTDKASELRIMAGWPVNEGLSLSGSMFQHPSAQSKRQVPPVSLGLPPVISTSFKTKITGGHFTQLLWLFQDCRLTQAAPSQSPRAF